MVSLTGTLSPHLVAALELVLAGVVEALEGSAAGVTLFDERGWQPVARVGYRLSAEELAALDPAWERLLPGVGGAVYRRQARVSISRPGRARVEDQAWSSLAEVLREGDRPIGVIYLRRSGRGPSPGRPTAAEARLLRVFAHQAVRALKLPAPSAAGRGERERLEELQNTFVSIVSHELQTPVAIIKSYAGALRRPDAGWGPGVVQRVAATIEAECDRLTRLITDLLDLARIQAGRVAMTFGAVDLSELLLEVVQLARARSPERQIRLEDVSGLPVVRGDHDKLRMALNNLLENAVKYSPGSGAITLGGSAEERRVLLWVRDQGIGVPPEERERIFERFHRIDTSLARETPGVGMGLYICKVIVEAHNGRIWVESEGLGRGSTFFIELPRVQP